ncbi:ATPase [Sphingomonas alpina]|uniref:ATPase n=1 Tax=Sphingomonas alpina TaxID=653931 RepID=A0A7H0LE43_9SPHN|nr:ATPase [Sphingomonas alpina]QNQ07946.1 ATPase [Sphingomonas alpina]
MNRFVLLSALAILPLATPAAADVVQATPAGFEIKQVVTVDTSIAQTWDTLRAPQRWWSKEHTYSDDSANLYLDSQATGCFCERMKGADRSGGSVEHARIVYIAPGRMIRLVGALGPLQAEAVTGTLTFKLDPEGSNATRVTMTYVVGGYVRAGADTLAPKVDEVLAVQMLGLKSAAESAPAVEPEKKEKKK